MRDNVFINENVVANGMQSATTMELMMGVDLRGGAGQVAGKTCHRHVF